MLTKVLKDILRHNNYLVYSRPFELNIVGLRSKSVVPNRFDDEIHVFYKGQGPLDWIHHVFKATTDPGTYWLHQPMQPQGTAILAQGQYIGAYALDLHRGQYEALVQKKPVRILRDYDRNAVLDFNNGNETTGQFGINIHRANRIGNTLHVDKHSAGCQVFQNADDYRVFMQLCHKHRDLYGNRFTYTLLDFRAVRRQKLRYIAGSLGAAALLGLACVAYTKREVLKHTASDLAHFFHQFFKQSNHAQQPQTHPPSTASGQGR